MADPTIVRAQEGRAPLLALRDVTLAFCPKVIQQKLSFDVTRGSIFAVMGGSGCGKSTVLKSMIGLLRPREGQFFVEGEDYWADHAPRRMTVGENVALPMQMFTKLDDAEIRRLSLLKLALVGMDHAYDQLPAELSGGM